MKKLNIGYSIPNVNDATAFYRTIGPLSYFHKYCKHLYSGFNFEPVTSVSYAALSKFDVLLVQRPAVEAELKLIEYAKKIPNLKIWVDYDDDVFCVPQENPAYELYAKAETKKVLARSLYLADFITVSTDALKAKFDSFLSKTDKKTGCFISKNALPTHLLRPPSLKGPRENLIVWRGGNSHVKDLMDYKSVIAQIQEEFPQYSWLFIGAKPWFLADVIPEKKLLFQPPLEILEYFNMLNTIRPKVFFIPLSDNEFNHSKSNIAALEAFYSGATCIAPEKLKEFDTPGCFLMDQNNPMGAVRQALNQSDDELDELSKIGLEYAPAIADKSIKLVEFISSDASI